MPLRLSLLAVVGALVVGGTTTDTQAARPVKAVGPVKAPVHFVLPKHPKPLSIAQRAVRIARTQLGVPYRYGGASPSGFDCSGLVTWVYGRLGISGSGESSARAGAAASAPETAQTAQRIANVTRRRGIGRGGWHGTASKSSPRGGAVGVSDGGTVAAVVHLSAQS